MLVVAGMTIIALRGCGYRRGDRRRRLHGRAGGTAEGADDPAPARPLHHLRLRPRRPARRPRSSGRPSVPYVVLDFHEDAVAAAREDGVLCSRETRREDENLRRAGLERAQGLVAASDSDADNLYVVLSARSARPELTIVARASGADAERKLRPRRRGPRRASVHDRGPGDGEPRAQAAGDRVPRRRDDGDRAPTSSSRRSRCARRARRPGGRSASCASATRRARSSSRCGRRTAASTRRRSRTRRSRSATC